MITYIRTEDGKIYNKSKIICSAFREDYISPDWNDDIEKYLQTKIVAEADTIEELCDGFWWENTMYKEPIFIPNYGLVLDRVIAWKESDEKLNDNSFDRITIYGSIYIQGCGWKHVCKVNKNEERLELL